LLVPNLSTLWKKESSLRAGKTRLLEHSGQVGSVILLVDSIQC
jgi:hypothetical protein